MKILYFLNLDQYATSVGIIQKSFSKKTRWTSKGHEVKLIFFYQEEPEKDLISSYGECILIRRQRQKLMGQFRLMRLLGFWPRHEAILFNEITDFCPDIVYHRTFEISGFVDRICKNNMTVIEVNGNQIGNLFAAKKGAIQVFLTRIKAREIKQALGTFLRRHKGVIFVTYELLELYERQSGDSTLSHKSVVIPNGIDVSTYQARKKDNSREVIKLVFIGTPGAAWHGIDVILAIAKKTVGVLEYHLIGVGFAEPSNLPTNVKLYGYLSEMDYRKIVADCDIGIGTLGLKTAGINEASPLKVREYVAAGLPIITAYNDTAFKSQNLPEWVLQLPNDSNLILRSLDKIVEFSKKYKDFIVPQSEAEFYFSSERLEDKRLSFFQKLVDNSFLE
jgi:glycosyltransferase involved in cell wall biosynthesis